MKKEKVFRSRVSVLLIGFLFATFIAVSIPVSQEKNGQVLYILGGSLLFCVLLLTGVRYIIAGNKLFVRIWFIPFASVNIADIASVERSYNPLSSPAASLKRLKVNSSSLISPVREKEFIDELKTVNPAIRVNVPEEKGIWRIWDWDI
jgi:hypothetical protein